MISYPPPRRCWQVIQGCFGAEEYCEAENVIIFFPVDVQRPIRISSLEQVWVPNVEHEAGDKRARNPKVDINIS